MGKNKRRKNKSLNKYANTLTKEEDIKSIYEDIISDEESFKIQNPEDKNLENEKLEDKILKVEKLENQDSDDENINNESIDNENEKDTKENYNININNKEKEIEDIQKKLIKYEYYQLKAINKIIEPEIIEKIIKNNNNFIQLENTKEECEINEYENEHEYDENNKPNKKRMIFSIIFIIILFIAFGFGYILPSILSFN